MAIPTNYGAVSDFYKKKKSTVIPNEKYASPYAEGVNQYLTELKNRPAFSYNPTSDTSLQTAQNQTMDAVSRAAARKGMLYSDSNKSQMGQEAMKLVPQFEQQAYGRYVDQGNDLYKNLQAYTNAENTNYGRYRDTVGDNRYSQEWNNKLEQQNFSNNITTKQLQNQLKQQRFANNVTVAGLTGYYNPYASVKVPNDVSQYSNDYSAEINRRMAENPNDPMIPYLQAAKAQKIFSNPELLSKYGGEYRTMSGQEQDIGRQSQDLDYKIKAHQFELMNDPNSYDNQSKAIALDRARAELAQVQAQDPDMIREESRLKIKQIQANIDQINSSTAANNALTNQRNSGGGITPSQQYTQEQRAYKENYQSALQQYANVPPEEMYNDLTGAPDDVISQVGTENYNKLMKYTQDKYYKTISNTWAQSGPEDIINSLETDRNYYISHMGESNFSTLYNKAVKELESLAKSYGYNSFAEMKAAEASQNNAGGWFGNLFKGK